MSTIKNNKVVLSGIAVAVTLAGASFFLTQSVSAQDVLIHPQDTLIQKLVEKFNLKKEDVQAVFDQEKTDRQQEMQKRVEERLSQLVTEGKITEEQKQLILNKQKELLSKRESLMESMKDMTPEERKAAKQEQTQALESWAKENGIDTSYLLGLGKGMKGMHINKMK